MASDNTKALDYLIKEGCIARLFVISDETYDQMVLRKLNSLNLAAKALAKTGLDEDQLKEIPPVYFHGLHIDKKSIERVGNDGKLRGSKYDATMLYFSDTQLFMYQYVFDLTEGTWKKEETLEFFYKDVVSFATVTKTSERTGKDVSAFSLKVSGDAFDCSISGCPDAEKVIAGMKQKLREKKNV